MADEFDWAAAALALFHCDSESMKDLARCAGLDADLGDLASIDLSGLDLQHQDFSGWDLRFANLSNAKVGGADLRGAKVDPAGLLKADGWETAKLDQDTREATQYEALLNSPVESIGLPAGFTEPLREIGIRLTRDLRLLSHTDAQVITSMKDEYMKEIYKKLSVIGVHPSKMSILNTLDHVYDIAVGPEFLETAKELRIDKSLIISSSKYENNLQFSIKELNEIRNINNSQKRLSVRVKAMFARAVEEAVKQRI